MTFAKQLMKLLPGVMAVGFVVSALAISFVAFSPHSTRAADTVTKAVTITTDSNGVFTFQPTTLNITVGTTVTWSNTTQAQHTATSNDGATFNSGTINPGSSFSFTFMKKGTVAYHCNFHPFMKATIIVS
jgi:plastocyanin